MRRLLSSLAAMSLLAVQQANAQLECLQPQERSVVEVAALRSELMVLATGCHQDERYNAFIRKYQADLMGNEKAVGDVFKRMYGKRAQQEHDRFTTDLANGESSAGMHLGTDFCAPQQPDIQRGDGAAQCRRAAGLCRGQGPGAGNRRSVSAGGAGAGAQAGRDRHQAPLNSRRHRRRRADRRVAGDQPHAERIGAGEARGRRVVDPRVVADGVDQHLAVLRRRRRARPASNGRPLLLTVMAHQPPSLPTFIATSTSRPAAGVTGGTVQAFAAPVMSAANTRAAGAGGGRSAQACSSNAVAAIASPNSPDGASPKAFCRWRRDVAQLRRWQGTICCAQFMARSAAIPANRGTRNDKRALHRKVLRVRVEHDDRAGRLLGMQLELLGQRHADPLRAEQRQDRRLVLQPRTRRIAERIA